ncbi:MAG TPA: amino acid--tRNA ligase-related protein, partial [Pyrinomonadaceae bacterium]|nr:amino acid--tRNA ligase-related protein [Pyrinomonadaceae bacterium]
MQTPFIEENDQTRTRREHLERIREVVGNVYPNKFRRTNVAGTTYGEDTVSALADRDTIKRVVADADFKRDFDALEAKVESGERPTPEDLEPVNAGLARIGTVRISGRLATPPRVMGKVAFVHLSDGRQRLQIYVRRDDVTEMPLSDDRTADGWELFRLLDHGDFIGVEGLLFVTKTGELSVHVRAFEFLSKALLPMPDKRHGIADPEIRQRQRYADLIASSLKVELDDEPAGELNTREVFERRSQIIREMRRYLDEHGYVEVETPILSPLASGAAARPFETYHNALGIKLYARIAPELYLKRLLVGGFERVYELNRNFRNEGISYKHNPEFTMLEFYCAYMDANGMMDFCEDMLRTTVERSTNKLQFDYGTQLSSGLTTSRRVSNVIDFAQPFQRLTMKQAIAQQWDAEDDLRRLDFNGEGFNISWLDDPRMTYLLCRFVFYLVTGTKVKGKVSQEKPTTTHNPIVLECWLAARNDLMHFSGSTNESETSSHIVFLFENMAEQNIIQPTFITDFPKAVSPLSKASPENPAVAERFELYIMGMECANGFSELNDPLEQEQRFDEQMRQRERGDDEAMQKDEDYLRAL